jgi:hypothetical protein
MGKKCVAGMIAGSNFLELCNCRCKGGGAGSAANGGGWGFRYGKARGNVHSVLTITTQKEETYRHWKVLASV